MLPKNVTNNRPVCQNQLIATLTKFEATRNSCHLPSTNDNINDVNALTSNHFLIGRSLIIQGTDQSNSKDFDSRRKSEVE